MLVTVFTGFLGAGKTTILQGVRRQLAEDYPDEKVLTIVNDVNEHNIDKYAFAASAGKATPQKGLDMPSEAVSALSGGCVCCNLLAELVKEVLRAHDEGYSYVFLECTGVADPVPVVATLSALPALKGKVSIDAIITVVHARAMLAAMKRGPPRDDARVLDMAAVDPLKGTQAQGANVLLINNWESLNVADASVLMDWRRALCAFTATSNPSARVFFTNNGGRFAFTDLVFHQRLFVADGVQPFFLRAYAESGKTLGELGDPAEEAGELASIGLRTFTFESATAVVSVAALSAALATPLGRSLLKDVWRSKGFFAAVDDCPEGEHVPTASSRTTPGSALQFRWQSVGKQFDFGHVLPPCVPLRSQPHGDATGHPLTCQVVFIGNFAGTVAAKESEVRSFFEHIAIN